MENSLKQTNISLKTILLLQALMVAAGGIAFWLALPFHTNAPKIGYVETTKMLGAFKEARKNQAEIDSLNKDWQSKAKVLKDSLDGYMKEIGTTFNKASLQSQQDMRKELERRNVTLDQYVKASQKRVLEREKELLEPTLKKINAALQEFARKEHYDLIFGSTNSGNILAGGLRLDLTDQVIRELNAKYP